MSPDKGPHRAIAAAEAAGVPLLMAAKMREAWEHQYFEEFVKPHLNDHIQYLGEVPHEQKLELLAGATALLNPIRWNEPFGLVMIEALACGTPVLAFPEGAAPEIVEDGVTGFLCADDRGHGRRHRRAPKDLDRGACRAAVETYFSTERMVNEHLDLFREMIGRPTRGDRGVPRPPRGRRRILGRVVAALPRRTRWRVGLGRTRVRLLARPGALRQRHEDRGADARGLGAATTSCVAFSIAAGPGPHHVTFKVPDIAAAIDDSRGRGLRPVGVDLSDPGWKEAFLHPKDAPGIVVQLAEAPHEWDSPPPEDFPAATVRAGDVSITSASLSLTSATLMRCSPDCSTVTRRCHGRDDIFDADWIELAWPAAAHPALRRAPRVRCVRVATTRAAASRRLHHERSASSGEAAGRRSLRGARPKRTSACVSSQRSVAVAGRPSQPIEAPGIVTRAPPRTARRRRRRGDPHDRALDGDVLHAEHDRRLASPGRPSPCASFSASA